MEDENWNENHENRHLYSEEKERRNEMKIDNSPDKKNMWMYASMVLGVAVIVLLVLVFRGGITGNVVSSDAAGENVVKFLEAQGRDATISSVSEENGFYKVLVSMDGQDIPAYVTEDGKFLTTGLIPLTENLTDTSNTDTETQTPTEVPKSDKPVVEAFIFSYCPYGTQFEKALIPVYDLLKDKADINIVAIGAMHGEYERVESLRQICIEKNYGRDTLFKYLKAFDETSAIGACSGTDTCVNPLIEKIFTTLKIDKAKINTCMEKDAPAIYDEQGARANSLGISGSPTFVINGAEVSASRNAEAIKKAVCDAFNTAPSECSQTLSTTGPSAGFGASSSSSASTGTQCN